MSASTNSIMATSSTEKNLMKEFISTVREYNKTKSEETASTLGRILQMLGMSLDVNIFEPQTSVATEFFASLYELMYCLNSTSPLIWSSVSVLQHACKNRSAHKSLIHTYHFIPVLSRFLGDHLTKEKKRKLLAVMQELTYGIKISWQISYLPTVLATLVRWIESGDETIVSLALGVLLNMCHSNLPVVYTLMRTTNTKLFLRKLLNMRSPLTEVQVCKLLITLEHLHGEVPDTDLLNFVRVTFKTITEAFECSDLVRLRHIVEFFLEVRMQPHRATAVRAYAHYGDDVNHVLDALENSIPSNQTDQDVKDISNSKRDPTNAECIALLYDFLRSLVELEIPELRSLYARIIILALRSAHTEITGAASLALLTSVTLQETSIQDLEPLVDELTTFIRAIDTALPPSDKWIRITALLRLINSIGRHKCLLPRLSNTFQKQIMLKIFEHLFNDETEGNSHEFTQDVYIYALSLISKLEKYDDRIWNPVLVQLLRNKQLQAIIARTLLSGTQETRAIVLEIVAANGFPIHDVSKTLCEVQPSLSISAMHSHDNSISCCYSSDNAMGLMFPIMTGAQIEQLDQAIARINEAYTNNQIASVATSEVLELYEYKVAAMGHAERLAQASLEAANKHTTHLQHRLAQMSAEASRLHQLLFHSQQCHEQAQERIRTFEQNIETLSNRLSKAESKNTNLSDQITEKNKTIEQHQDTIGNLDNKLSEIMQNLNQVTKKCEDHVSKNKALVTAFAVFENNLKCLENTVQEKEEQLAKCSRKIDVFGKQIENLEQLRMQHEGVIATKNNELSDALKELADTNQELTERKKILEAITNLTKS